MPGDAPDRVHNFSTELVVPPAGGVIGLGVNCPETCAGRPLNVRFTGELNPYIEVAVAVRLPHCPVATVSWLGNTDKPKSAGGAPLTIRLTIALRESIGTKDEPVIVRLYEPKGVAPVVATLRVSVTDCPAVKDTDVDGANDAVAPAGKPVTPRFTVPAKVPIEVTVTV